ncbi:MAG: phospho-sugar mutase [Myxococcota bacterium]
MTTPALTPELIARARAFAAHDPDPAGRAEIEAMVAARDPELAARFAGPLAFGTAGLRGLLGAGESRMNRAVVIRTTAGIAAWLRDTGADPRRGVVVGYDGRRQSDVFARDAAAVLLAAGFVVHLGKACRPTPLCAFAVRQVRAVAGIVVTASHNPPDYNGYKVYAADGAQITAPTDRAIATAIEAVPPADEVPRADLEGASPEDLRWLDEAMDRDYLAAVRALVPRAASPGDLRIAYTPLHGVGAPLLRRALNDAGFTDVHVVAEQAEPDGAFPTVSFPNPEEKGAMDLALALGRRVGADLVIANDPDADRLACSVRPKGDEGGAYVALTGNEVGCLLGDYALARLDPSGEERLIVNTIVSSPWLARIAAYHGAQHAMTLTGFKWIAAKAMDLERTRGARFVFGYEEALGYATGRAVRDKDGISAALALVTYAAELKARGETLLDAREQLWRRHGVHLSAQRAQWFEGADGAQRMARLMGELRDAPPRTLADAAVVTVTDCLRGTIVTIADGAETNLDLPRSDVLGFALASGDRVLVRPSGTEPKLKLYVDVCRPVGDDDLASARTDAEARLEALVVAMRHHLETDPS